MMFRKLSVSRKFSFLGPDRMDNLLKAQSRAFYQFSTQPDDTARYAAAYATGPF
jgi:hypothetical protein